MLKKRTLEPTKVCEWQFFDKTRSGDLCKKELEREPRVNLKKLTHFVMYSKISNFTSAATYYTPQAVSCFCQRMPTCNYSWKLLKPIPIRKVLTWQIHANRILWVRILGRTKDREISVEVYRTCITGKLSNLRIVLLSENNVLNISYT